ncbi:MAG: ABC transporter permease [Devosia sp.]
MRTALRNGFLALVGMFLLLPLLIVVGVSVNAAKQLSFPPQGISLAWYGAIWSEPDWRLALQNSVLIGVCSAGLAVSIAMPLCYALWRRPGPLSRTVFSLGLAPLTLPPVILAIGFLTFWINVGGYGQIYATIIAHAIFLVTVPIVTIGLGYGAIDRHLVEAARTIGATDRAVFSTIVLPLIRPYIISGFAFAFVLSLNEYIIAYMVSGFTVETVPIRIFNAIRYGYTPIMASASVVFVLTSIIIFSLVARWGDLPKLLGAGTRSG